MARCKQTVPRWECELYVFVGLVVGETAKIGKTPVKFHFGLEYSVVSLEWRKRQGCTLHYRSENGCMPGGERMMRLVLAFVLLLVVVVIPASAQEREHTCEALFVQNAKNVAMDTETLTLQGVGPTVIFFCDRPERLAGHLSLEEFLQSWTQRKDNFTTNPPNAVLSVLSGGEPVDVVVELTKPPRVRGDEMTYAIRILEGEAPKTGGPSALFIDVIGRPMTPMSIAGVHRRYRRRAIRRCAAGVTCW